MMIRKVLILLIASLGAISCRDESLLNAPRNVTGYLIEGTLLDGLDRPISNINVSLFLVPDFISNTPVPDRDYTPQTPGEFVTVNVYDYEGALVRNLYSGNPGPTLSVAWDERENNGSLAGSGVYTIRFIVSGATRHSYVHVVDGNVTARTDSDGLFTIPNKNLPAGYYPAPLYTAAGSFTGNYRILSWVYLDFTIGSQTYSRRVDLKLDRVTRVLVRVN